MTHLLRHNMHVTNDVKNTLLAMWLSSLDGQFAYIYVRASLVSDIM